MSDRCPQCEADVPEGTAACPSCGADIAGATASFAPVDSGAVAPTKTDEALEGPVLVVRKGPTPGERFFLESPRLSIGRDPDSDIFLNDMTVSRAHAALDIVGGEVTVRDLGSLNGTYVNGVIVDAARLGNGDVLQIGTFQMVFVGAGGMLA